MSHPLASKPAVTIALCGALVAVPYVVPGLGRWRLLSPRPRPEVEARAAAAPAATVGESVLRVATRERSELGQPEEAARDREVLPLVAEKRPPRSIEDPSGRALDAFYAALERTERKAPGAITRIAQYGDSLLVTDWVTGTLRRRLQERFGDAGHGFLLIAAGWPGYFHNDVVHTASAGWSLSRVVGPLAPDGMYGLGGVSFRGTATGLSARFATASKGSFGRNVSRFVLSYVRQPGGGEIAIAVDGEERERLSTEDAEVRAATHVVRVPDGPHQLELRTTGPRPVRAFGVWLERDAPGVVLDTLGILGAHVRQLGAQDEAHWAERLRERRTDLVVFEYGINEAEDGFAYPVADLEATMKDVLRRAREALPRSSCLVVGALDRAEKVPGGYGSKAFIPTLVRVQRKAALESGCAFWDALGAMGGPGSMGVWIQRGLGSHDLAHPSSTGAEVLGTWIYRAMMEGYNTWRQRADGAADGAAD